MEILSAKLDIKIDFSVFDIFIDFFLIRESNKIVVI